MSTGSNQPTPPWYIFQTVAVADSKRDTHTPHKLSCNRTCPPTPPKMELHFFYFYLYSLPSLSPESRDVCPFQKETLSLAIVRTRGKADKEPFNRKPNGEKIIFS